MYASELAGHMNVYAEAMELAADTDDSKTFVAVIRHIAGEMETNARSSLNVGYEPDHYAYGETSMITDYLDTCPVEYTNDHVERVEKLAQIILGYN